MWGARSYERRFSPTNTALWIFSTIPTHKAFDERKQALTGDLKLCFAADDGSELWHRRLALVDAFVRPVRARVDDGVKV